MKYPLLIKPDDHRLDRYYKSLNALSYVFVVAALLVNELLVRPRVLKQEVSADSILGGIFLLINLKSPPAMTTIVVMVVIVFSLLCVVLEKLQPKWGLKNDNRQRRSGFPKFAEYPDSYFLIADPLQHFCFVVWHRFFAVSIHVLACIPVCMFISLLREL